MSNRKGLLAAAAALVLLLGYLAFAPVPTRALAWNAPKAPGYVGPHAVNTRLAGLRTIALGEEAGPEHVAIGPDGKLYAAVASGTILRMEPDGTGVEAWARTGGRVLGFDFDARGRLIAADAIRGLLAIDTDRRVEVLVDKVRVGDADDPVRYANSVVVARSGLIYFSDATRRFGARDWGGTFEASVLDILEHSSTGRVIEYDPASGRTHVVIERLCFANGVALSADERSLFVAETGEYRVWKVDADASGVDAKSAAGGHTKARLVLQNLPGFPDNLTRGKSGRLWLGFAKPRAATVDAMSGVPWLRQVTLRLPRALWPVPPAYGHVIAFDENGKVLADLQDPAGAYPETTGVLETAERLYVQSLHAGVLGWRPRAGLGLE